MKKQVENKYLNKKNRRREIAEMKKYDIKCLECGEDLYLYANDPAQPYCVNCGKNIDIDEMKYFVDAWHEYLKDCEEFIASTRWINLEK